MVLSLLIKVFGDFFKKVVGYLVFWIFEEGNDEGILVIDAVFEVFLGEEAVADMVVAVG